MADEKRDKIKVTAKTVGLGKDSARKGLSINRRGFLQSGLVAGAVAAISAPALARVNSVKGEQTGVAAPQAFEFEEVTLSELQDAMQSGRKSSHAIVAAYLARVQEIDKAGPAVNSIIELNPDALETADRLDAERRAGRIRG